MGPGLSQLGPPSSWCRGSPARLRVCLALGVVGGRPPAVLCRLPASSPGALRRPSHNGAASHRPCCGCTASGGVAGLGGRILGPRRSPPAVSPALGLGGPLQSRLLHLSPCWVLSRRFWPKSPWGNKRQSHRPAGQVSGRLITLDKRQQGSSPWTRGSSLHFAVQSPRRVRLFVTP